MLKGLLKLALVTAGVAIFIGYLVHDPLPLDVPERRSAQIGCDMISFVEFIASVIEFLRFSSSRWWAYQLFPEPKIDAYTNIEDFNIFEKQMAGVDCVFVQPKELQTTPTPAIVFFFGGGFVSGSAVGNLPKLMLAAKETGYLIVAPNYRKAPQHPFPIPFEDCLNSTIEFMKRAKEFNVDSSKIAISGASAGGNLAMSVTIELSKKKKNLKLKHGPAMLCIMEAFIQMANFRLPSHQSHTKCILPSLVLPKYFLAYIGLNHRMDLSEIAQLNRHIRPEIAKQLRYISYEALPEEYQLEGMNSSALPLSVKQATLLDDEVLDLIEKAVLDPRISPLSALDEELAQLPRTHVSVCEYDALRDEGVILHERLKKLGKDVSMQILEKSTHGSTELGAMLPENTYYREQIKITFQTIKFHLQRQNP